MVLTIRVRVGMGTLLNPTFRVNYFSERVKCNRIEKPGNLVYLYDYSGYVIRTVDPNDIMEKL